MANKNGVVGIALNVDYEKALKQMVAGFNQALTQISNEAKKIEYAGDVKEQIKGIKGELKGFSDEFRAELKKINGQQIDSGSFKKFEAEVTERFENIEKKFASINTKIHGLKTQLGLLEGSDTASKMKSQFDDWRTSIVNTYQELQKVVDLVDTSKTQNTTSANVKDIREQLTIYRSTLRDIQKMRTEKNKLSNVNDDFHLKEEAKALRQLEEIAKTSGIKQISDDLSKAEKNIKTIFSGIKSETNKLGTLDEGTVDYTTTISNIAKLRAEAIQTAKEIERMDQFLLTNSSSYDGLKDRTWGYIDKVYGDIESDKDTSSFLYQISEYISQAEKFIEQNKNVKDSVETITTSINTFTIKNGAIQIPIEVAKDKEVSNEITKAIKSMQSYVDKHPVVAQVKLVLDGQSTKAYKTQGDIAKQLEDGQNKPAVDISKAIKKTYIQSVKEAEEAANKAISKIKSMFDSSPIKVSIDDKAFAEDLSSMVNSSLGKIANDATGLNVNSELEKLIGNLKEVSSSLSGNENFKFGLDEASIERITAAIRDMADMIQRALGVASNDDIVGQWTAIESKFKGVAGEEGKLLKGNKEHKIAIQELAVEYKKYLDMGGKNDLSTLTAHKQTVKNITAEYENLGKAAQEAAQKQEKVAKKPASKKVSSEESEAIKGVTRENKKLETQAGKTGVALDNEGKSAQSASEKFRKLAKEKGAAVVANRELAKAAKETADALEKEARIRKETGTKTGKGAVDELTYADNFSKWQREIKQSLIDSGNYAEVYDAKVSQASDGTVKFTAVIRDLDGVLKKFSAKVNDVGKIYSPSISDMPDKQAALFKKRQRDAQKVLDAMAAMEGGAEKPFLDRAELERSISALIEAEEELDRFKIKKVSLEEDGKLAITTEIKEANGQVKTFIATFDSISDIIDEETGSVKNFAKAMESAYDSGKFVVSKSGSQSSVLSRYEEIYEIAKKLGSLDIKIAGLDSNKNANQIQELTAQYRELDEVYTKLVSEFFKDTDVGKLPMGSIQELNDVFENVKKRIDEIKAKLRDAQENLEKGFSSKAQDAFNKFDLKYKGSSNWGQVSDEFERLRQSIAGIDSQDKLNEFKQNLSDIAVRLNNIGKDNKLGDILGGERTFKDINEVRANIDSLFSSMGKVNEKSIRVKGTDKMTAEVKAANGEIRKMTVSLDSKGFARFVDNGIVQFGRLRAAAEGVFKGIQSMVRIYLSPQDFIRYFRQGFDAVREIDTAMTELKKVSDAPMGDIVAYFDDAVASAKELGSSVNEMIGATADWQRMGYNLPDSRELGEVAVLYKNVGDGIDVDTANESLVSTIQGFQLQAKDAMSVIDAFNEVSNNYAISSGGIGEALKRSAAAFNAANTDLNQSIALITAGNEIVQSPEKVGKHYANLYSNVLIIKVAISVKSQRWSRPR